jgi:hypothetical protein
MGHRAADDVYGRVYTLDHPELTPLENVARVLEEIIRGSIGSLIVPTTRRIRWGHSNRYLERAAHVDATLGAAGWMIDPDSVDDPLCDTIRVAAELGIGRTTARGRMRDGTLTCVIVADGDGVERRWTRLSAVLSLRDRLRDRVQLPDLADQLGVRYHDLYQTARRLGLQLDRHPTSRQFEISVETGQRLRDEYGRLRALHQRSMKLAAAATRLNLAVSTIGVMAKRGQLDVDPETDGSNARFVTRESVERYRTEHQDTVAEEPAAVRLGEIVRFTDRGPGELLDLVRAGVLHEVRGRGPCRLTTASLRTWMTG